MAICIPLHCINILGNGGITIASATWAAYQLITRQFKLRYQENYLITEQATVSMAGFGSKAFLRLGGLRPQAMHEVYAPSPNSSQGNMRRLLVDIHCNAMQLRPKERTPFG